MLKQLGEHAGHKFFIAVFPSVDFWDGWSNTHRGFRLLLFLDKEQVRDYPAACRLIDSAVKMGANSIMFAGTAGELMFDLYVDQTAEYEALQKQVNTTLPRRNEPGLISWNIKDSIDKVLWDVFFVQRCNEEIERTAPPVVAAFLKEDPRILAFESFGVNLEKTFHKVLG